MVARYESAFRRWSRDEDIDGLPDCEGDSREGGSDAAKEPQDPPEGDGAEPPIEDCPLIDALTRRYLLRMLHSMSRSG